MHIQQSPYMKMYKQILIILLLRADILKIEQSNLSKKGAIKLYNKRAIIASHHNFQVHKQLLLFLLVDSRTNSLNILIKDHYKTEWKNDQQYYFTLTAMTVLVLMWSILFTPKIENKHEFIVFM